MSRGLKSIYNSEGRAHSKDSTMRRGTRVGNIGGAGSLNNQGSDERD
jgi:hypothetical protein